MSATFKLFPDCYRKLVLCESISSVSTGDSTPPTIHPTAVITDVRLFSFPKSRVFENHAQKYNYLPILRSVREISGKKVPVWSWLPTGAYLPLCIFGPEKYGGLGDVENKARHLAEATGRDVEEVMIEVCPLYFQYIYQYRLQETDKAAR